MKLRSSWSRKYIMKINNENENWKVALLVKRHFVELERFTDFIVTVQIWVWQRTREKPEVQKTLEQPTHSAHNLGEPSLPQLQGWQGA